MRSGFSRFYWYFCIFFLETFMKTRVLKVILFWELSQQIDILVVFLFKVYMRSAVFRYFCSIYTFLFRILIKTRFLLLFLKFWWGLGFSEFSPLFLFFISSLLWVPKSFLDFLVKGFMWSRVSAVFLWICIFSLKGSRKVMSDTLRLVSFIWSKERLFLICEKCFLFHFKSSLYWRDDKYFVLFSSPISFVVGDINQNQKYKSEQNSSFM